MYARTPSNAQHLLTLQEFKAATADLPDDHDHLPVLVEAEIRLLQPLLAGLQDALDRKNGTAHVGAEPQDVRAARLAGS